jgi:hypothetical protein
LNAKLAEHGVQEDDHYVRMRRPVCHLCSNECLCCSVLSVTGRALC